MQHGPRFVFYSPRIPWWGWIILLPLGMLGLFLGAVFLFLLMAVAFAAAMILWVRWKWSARGMSGRKGQGAVRREYHVLRKYDYELKKLDDQRGE